MRNRNIKQCNPFAAGYLKYYDFDLKQEEESDDNYINNQLEEILMTTDGYDAEFDHSDSSDDDFKEEEDVDKSSDDEDEEIIIETAKHFQNYLQCAKNMLKVLLIQRGYDKVQCKQIIQTFNKYIDASDEELSDFQISDDDFSWLQIRSIDGFKEIGDIALRLINSAVSEASCERDIKVQRQIHTKRRMRSKKQLLDARSILASK